MAEDFRWRYQERSKTDQVVEFCRTAPTLVEAIRRAVEARDADGKHHNHQSKVDIIARRTFGNLIWRERNWLRRMGRERELKELEWYTKFDFIYEWMDEIKPVGIGPVTVYDVCVRICAFLGIEPKSVYLHAGVKQGIKALMPGNDWRQVGRVPMYMFPEPFCDMTADEVEDILCTYREVFLTWHE